MLCDFVCACAQIIKIASVIAVKNDTPVPLPSCQFPQYFVTVVTLLKCTILTARFFKKFLRSLKTRVTFWLSVRRPAKKRNPQRWLLLPWRASRTRR